MDTSVVAAVNIMIITVKLY